MPAGQTRFQEKWMESLDANKELIGSWCTKGKNDWEAFCFFCSCPVSVGNGGISTLKQHSTRNKHIAAAKRRKGQTTLLQHPTDVDDATVHASENMCSTAISVPKLVTRAEAVWAMKVAVSHYSFASCTDVVKIFRIMFPEHAVAENMSLGDRKVSYVISHGLGPFFQSEIISDLQAAVSSGSLFTLAFDESTTVQIKKQLDILVRYWSPKFNKIISGYVTSLFFGHADAEAISNGIMTVLEANKIPLDKVLMLSMDGPKVNLAVAKKLNEERTSLGSPELFDLGTCNLHKVHNCFAKALATIPLDIDELATDLFAFFKVSAARREDLLKVEKLLECEEKFMLRHVSSRWLTLGPVVSRILTLYPVLQEYFLQVLPKTKSVWGTLKKNARYKRISCVLKDPMTVAYLHFISAIFPTLQEYLSLFQTEGPLIHLMFGKMNFLIRSVMLRFLKDEVVGKLEGKDLGNINVDDFENYLPLKDMNIGEGTRRALTQQKDSDKKEARMAFRTFLVKLCKLLKEALPFEDLFLKDLECLHPAMKVNQNVIRRLCRALKPLNFDVHNIDKIVDEWTMYKCDADVEELVKDYCEADNKNIRIDHYWRKVFDLKDKISGEAKFLNLATLVKSCISLAHGNADVERGFSINNNIVTKHRACLSENTIIAIRHVIDAVKRYGGICDVPLTKNLVTSVSKSHSTYMAEKEAEKKAAEEIKRKRALEEEQQNVEREAKRLKSETEEKLKEIDRKIQDLKLELLSTQNCLSEGNQRLQKAIKTKSFDDIRIASTIIEAATSKNEKLTKQLNEANTKKFKIQSLLKS